ncbi:MAG: RNA polymerase sigma-70 factor [Draconibacterium sp.]
MGSISSDILKLLNNKQDAAFEVVFNLYYPRLVYFAREYVREADAKNLVQDAFVSMWERKPQFMSEAQLQSYLYTNVKNSCLMLLRHEKVKKKFATNLVLKKQNQLYERALKQVDTSELAIQEMEKIIARTLSELPDRCREIFILSRMEGKKNQEVADQLSISVKAVEAQITKALKIFRVALKEYLPLVAFLLVMR